MTARFRRRSRRCPPRREGTSKPKWRRCDRAGPNGSGRVFSCQRADHTHIRRPVMYSVRLAFLVLGIAAFLAIPSVAPSSADHWTAVPSSKCFPGEPCGFSEPPECSGASPCNWCWDRGDIHYYCGSADSQDTCYNYGVTDDCGVFIIAICTNLGSPENPNWQCVQSGWQGHCSRDWCTNIQPPDPH
jgi:hypothetical protein